MVRITGGQSGVEMDLFRSSVFWGEGDFPARDECVTSTDV